MTSKHDKAVKKRKKREQKQKARKSEELGSMVSEEDKQLGKVGIMIFVTVGILAAVFIIYSYS